MNLLQERIAHCCQRLKLSRIANDWPAVAEEAVKNQVSLGELLEKILAAECEERDQRSREVLLKLATLPAVKTLEGYDFAFASGAPRKQIVELGGLAFIEKTQDKRGCWIGRWGVNYLYGTWQVLVGLAAAGFDMQHPMVRRAVD